MTIQTRQYSKDKASSFDYGLRQYMLRVYNYMTIGLIITALAAMVTVSLQPVADLMFQFSSGGRFIGYTWFGVAIAFSPLIIGFYFVKDTGRINAQTAQTLFFVYAVLTGMSIASLGYVYTGESIARTFFICSATFAAMSIYGYSTEKDLTSAGSFMMMGLFGILFASLANVFFQSQALSFAISIIGVVIFIVLTAWDTQRLKNMYYFAGGGEMAQRISVVGAFSLYLNFINLFIYMLRLFGDRRD